MTGGTASATETTVRRTTKLSIVAVLSGVSLVGVSVFHHWLGTSGNTLRGYHFVSENVFYTSRTALLVPLVVILALEFTGTYDRAESVLLVFTGVASGVYPVWMLLLANQRGELLSWHPELAFYTSLLGATLLYIGGMLRAREMRTRTEVPA